MSQIHKNIAILISGNGSNLQSIIDQVTAGKITANICLVLSNVEDAFGLQRAQQAGIATEVLVSKHSGLSREEYDAQLAKVLAKYEPDLIVLAGFMRILSFAFVKQFEGKMINIHPSLLPKYKGLHTHQRALDNKDNEHGVSVHFVTAELDGGPVILQARVPVFPEDNVDELAARVQQQEHHIYPMVVKWFVEDRLYMREGIAYLDDQPLPSNGYAAD